MTCTAFLRCAALLGAGLSVPLASRAEAPAPYPVGRELPAFEAPASAGDASPRLPPEPTGVLRLADALAAALLRNPELAADRLRGSRARSGAAPGGRTPEPDRVARARGLRGLRRLPRSRERADHAAARSADRARRQARGAHRPRGGRPRPRGLGLRGAAHRRLRSDRGRVRRRARGAGAAPARGRGARARALDAARGSLRLRAGIASPAEEIRAEVQVDVASVEREHTEHELATARQALAAMWAGEAPRFERAEGDLERLPSVPSAEEIERRLESSPSVVRWQAELARRDALRARARRASACPT